MVYFLIAFCNSFLAVVVSASAPLGFATIYTFPYCGGLASSPPYTDRDCKFGYNSATKVS